MKIIGLAITLIVLSLLFVWWLNLSIGRSNNAVDVINKVDGTGNAGSYTGDGPIEYSKDKIDELNRQTDERSQEMEVLP